MHITRELVLPPLTNDDHTLAVAHALLAGQLAPTSIAIYARDVRAYLRFAQSPAAALMTRLLHGVSVGLGVCVGFCRQRSLGGKRVERQLEQSVWVTTAESV